MARKTVKMATLDTSFRKAVHEQYDYICAFDDCEYCGNHSFRYNGQIECAHYYNRYRSSGRWHPDNCAALCHDQHMFLEHNKALEVNFFAKLLGETRHDMLIERHQGIYRYKSWERWEMNQHYRAQRVKMVRQRANGGSGYLVLTPWD